MQNMSRGMLSIEKCINNKQLRLASYGALSCDDNKNVKQQNKKKVNHRDGEEGEKIRESWIPVFEMSFCLSPGICQSFEIYLAAPALRV